MARLYLKTTSDISRKLVEGWLQGLVIRHACGKLRRMLRLGGAMTLLEEEGIPASSDYDFQRWLWNNHPRPWQLETMSAHWQEFSHRPSFSIILPVYDPDPHFLATAIESVLTQAYPQWQLCIWMDGPQPSQVQRILEAYSGLDSRIHVGSGKVHEHVSLASNHALAMADGELVGLLDQDDVLPPHALYRMVERINQQPNLDFIYSDESNLDEHGKLCRPFFKPDWSPDYFNSLMYTCHFQVFSQSILRQVGAFRSGYEGSQDWDLVLRVTEATSAIGHVSDILYHWRIHQGSTTKEGAGAKDYAQGAAVRAITDAIHRRGEPGTVFESPRAPRCYDVRYDIIDAGKISIVIPFRDQPDILDRCLDSLYNSIQDIDCNVILVDNLSREMETSRIVDKWKGLLESKLVLLHWNYPFNYARLHNDIVPDCDGKYLVFLNNDTEVLSMDWLTSMMEYAQKPRIGAVGGLLLYPDMTIQHAGVILGLGGTASHGHRSLPLEHSDYFNRARLVGNFLSLCAACMMCRKDVFHEVGGFDENFSHNYNDVDFCLKLYEEGLWNVYLPHVRVMHYESKTRNYQLKNGLVENTNSEMQLLQSKWMKYVKSDPFYNSHLTLDFEDYRIKDPCYYKKVLSQRAYE